VSSFTTPIALEPLDVSPIDARNWRLLVEFDFASQVLERILRVPVGFVTDFASTPRILWSLLPPTGTYSKAAMVHDDCYRTPGICTRRDADATFFEAMTALRVGWLTRWAMWAGVRVGGTRSYKGGL